MITANDWIRVSCPELHHLEQEMNAYAEVQIKSEHRGATQIVGPKGYQTFVSRRFADWFLPRNTEWKEVKA